MADRRIALSELVTRLELNQYPVKLIDRVDLTFVQEPSERLAALGRFLQEVGGLEAPELAEPG